MKSARALLIAALFFIDVRVRADAECWGKQIPCSIPAAHGRREVKSPELRMVLAEGSLAHQRTEKDFQLVSGRIYVEASKPVAFKTPYAEISCAGDCKAMINREYASVTVKSLEGEWIVRRLGDRKPYGLVSGLQLTVGEVETNGMARMELPQSLPWDSTVLEWAKIYAGPVELFKSDVARFRADWRAAVTEVSELHESLAGRALASHEESLAKERARQKAAEKEDAQLRALLRQKNHLD